MSRIVLIANSSTGKLIDVAGNEREGGRYKKFAKRLLSLDTNPILDYGGNGGSKLTISCNGGNGDEIALNADTVVVPNELTIAGKTVAEIAADQGTTALSHIIGTKEQISVTDVPNTDNIQIALDESVVGKLDMIDAAIGGLSKFVLKSDIETVIKDLKVEDDDTLEDVKGTLRVLLERLNELVNDTSSSS